MRAPHRQDGTAVPDREALFESLFEQTSVGIALGSPEGRFLRVNEALCRMLGYDAGELIERSFQDITHPDDQQASRDFLQEVLTASQSRVYEKRYLRKDGSTLWVRITGTFLRDGSGAPQCSVALVYDITRQKAAEEALRASENRFRRMVEMGSDWYWVQDENFRFVELAGLEKRGLGPESFLGKTRWELPGRAPLPERVWQQHREKLERHEPFSDFVYVGTDPDGAARYLSVTGEPVFDAQGRFSGYHGIGKDITDTAKAQKALEDSELRYLMLFDIHPHPMLVIEYKTLRFLAVNQAAVNHYGYTREEFLSMSVDQLRHPDEVAKLLRDFQDQSHSYMQRVARHLKKGGEEIDVDVVSFNLEFDGKPARLGVINDVTEQLKSESEARELEQRYKQLLASKEEGKG